MSERNSTEFGTAISGLIGAVLLVAVVYFATVARFAADSAGTGKPEEIAARIKPVGSVTLAGGDAVAPPVAASTASPATAAAGPGEEIYNKACFACHASGAAGAPKIDDKAAWEPRVVQGVDQLLHTAINGKGGMPPKGTCATCSDDDLMAAIKYMLARAGFAPAATPDAGREAEAEQASVETAAESMMEGMSGMSGMSGEVAAPSIDAVPGAQPAPTGQ